MEACHQEGRRIALTPGLLEEERVLFKKIMKSNSPDRLRKKDNLGRGAL